MQNSQFMLLAVSMKENQLADDWCCWTASEEQWPNLCVYFHVFYIFGCVDDQWPIVIVLDHEQERLLHMVSLRFCFSFGLEVYGPGVRSPPCRDLVTTWDPKRWRSAKTCGELTGDVVDQGVTASKNIWIHLADIHTLHTHTDTCTHADIHIIMINHDLSYVSTLQMFTCIRYTYNLSRGGCSGCQARWLCLYGQYGWVPSRWIIHRCSEDSLSHSAPTDLSSVA